MMDAAILVLVLVAAALVLWEFWRAWRRPAEEPPSPPARVIQQYPACTAEDEFRRNYVAAGLDVYGDVARAREMRCASEERLRRITQGTETLAAQVQDYGESSSSMASPEELLRNIERELRGRRAQ